MVQKLLKKITALCSRQISPKTCWENKLSNNKNFSPSFFGSNYIFGDWIESAKQNKISELLLPLEKKFCTLIFFTMLPLEFNSHFTEDWTQSRRFCNLDSEVKAKWLNLCRWSICFWFKSQQFLYAREIVMHGSYPWCIKSRGDTSHAQRV